MSINQYNLIQTIGPIAFDAARITDHDVVDLDGVNNTLGGAPRVRLAGGRHPSGSKLLFAGRTDGDNPVADDDPASVVLHAAVSMDSLAGAKGGTLVTMPLTSAFEITYGAKTIERKVRIDGEDTTLTLRLADTVATPTLTGFGSTLLSAYSSFQPVAYSPGSNGIGCLLLPQLPAMDSLVVDIYGSAADDRFVLVDSHS